MILCNRLLIASGGAMTLIALASRLPAQSVSKTFDAESIRYFQTQVRPILDSHCLKCHGKSVAYSGDLRLTSRENILKGGKSGPAVDLNIPGNSLLLKAINYQGRQMPPSGKLDEAQIDILMKWVNMGLPYVVNNAGVDSKQAVSGVPQVTAETKKFWSFQPVKRLAPPAVKNRAWVTNPIDAFVLAKLEQKNLKPALPASKATLIRRATYDLTGLPPSIEDVKRFVADNSANAWEKVIDRLLAAPQYGEKWGRHWLDLVHYAETNSYERDGPKPFAWRYRDYVINSFNSDKPYDQFVKEQLAGDELPNRNAEKLIATGYYRLGIWDDEPVDRVQALYDDLDDIVSTTGQVFLGLTVGCARCHDHKIDPIPQKDYYRMVSFFAGVTRFGDRSYDSIESDSLRPISPPDVIRKHSDAVANHKENERQNRDALAQFDRKLMPDLLPVEKEDWRDESRRLDLLRKREGKLFTASEVQMYVGLTETRSRLRQFRPPALEQALAITETAEPRATHILMRGNPHVLGDEVKPAFLQITSPPDPVIEKPIYGDSSGRRTSLANWIASKDNALSTRVIVNRVWQYHFGRGIVRTPSNFGFQGTAPTNLELLDWLASELPAQRWKLKSLHKLIMMSSTYRMSTQAEKTALAKDPENDLMWRFDMRRLEAEEIRDSILTANGSLNMQMGGPSVFVPIPAAVLAGQSVPGSGWGKSPPDQEARRSVYIFVKRSLIAPIVASFDGPETDFSCPVRFATTQPTQALGMLNSVFINEQAKVFAAYLVKTAGPNVSAQVKLGLTRVLQREPTQTELNRGLKLIESMKSKHKTSDELALQKFCVVALNLNEFVYID